MGFSISDLNPTSLLSNAAESLSDAVLPDNLEFLGDLAGLAVDFQSGNYLKCLEDLQDLAQDLPQQLAQFAPSQLQSQSRTWATGGRGDELMAPTFLEPSPPPAYGAARNTQTTTTTTTTTTTNGATLMPANTGGPAGGFNANVLLSPSNPGHPPLPHQWTQDVVAPVVRGTPAPSTPIQASPSALAFGATGERISSQPASLSTAASSGSARTDPLFGLSDAALMEAVRNGQIPESITKDPAKMQQLQARINHISEMNQLISQMMAALHDMMKTVIQNIRA